VPGNESTCGRSCTVTSDGKRCSRRNFCRSAEATSAVIHCINSSGRGCKIHQSIICGVVCNVGGDAVCDVNKRKASDFFWLEQMDLGVVTKSWLAELYLEEDWHKALERQEH